MSFLDHFRKLKSPELRTAWAVALAADAIQIIFFPLFAEGAISPAYTVLDLTVATILTSLLGWHWEFLPSLLSELVPGLDLFPTWTAAVWYVTRNQAIPETPGDAPAILKGDVNPEPEFLPPGPAPARRN